MAYWYRRVFLLAIPLILSNLTQPLLSTVDTVLSGHLPGIQKGFAAAPSESVTA